MIAEHLPAIVKSVIYQPNPEFKDAYLLLANCMNSLIYPTRYKIDAYFPDYRINKKEINKNFFYLYLGETMIDEFSKDKLSFLHDTLFDLTDQKEVLCSCENMFNICKMIVDTISIYENSFDLLISSFVILKRIYFAFPQFIGSIEDCLVLVLSNICLIKSQVLIDNKERH